MTTQAIIRYAVGDRGALRSGAIGVLGSVSGPLLDAGRGMVGNEEESKGGLWRVVRCGAGCYSRWRGGDIRLC